MEALIKLFFVHGRVADLKQAYLNNPHDTVRLIFYWRDRNKGLGRRHLFHLAFCWVVNRDPSLLRLLPRIPTYGSWKDLIILSGMIPTALEPVAVLFSAQLRKDQLAMRQGKYVTTAAKWFPSSHSTYGRSPLTKRVQELLDVNEEGMRRTFLSPLRHYLQLPERHLSTHQPVNHLRVTRGAAQRYAQTFRRADSLWQSPDPRVPRSLLDIVNNVLRGQVLNVDKYWDRYKDGASAVGIAVVCDPRGRNSEYPIAFALATGKEGIYTYSDPSIPITFPPGASLPLKVASLQATRTDPQLSLSAIAAPCIVVVTSQPLPSPLPQLQSGQRLIWWRYGGEVEIHERGLCHIEICGFDAKLFSSLSKGNIPSLAHIVTTTLEKYSTITIDGS